MKTDIFCNGKGCLTIEHDEKRIVIHNSYNSLRLNANQWNFLVELIKRGELGNLREVKNEGEKKERK